MTTPTPNFEQIQKELKDTVFPSFLNQLQEGFSKGTDLNKLLFSLHMTLREKISPVLSSTPHAID